MRTPTFIALATSLLASAFTLEARAQSRDAAAAEALFRQGRERMEAGDLANACPKFAESLRLDFAAGTLLNLAACEEQSGKLANAWEHFARLLEVLPASDDRRPFAKEHLAELEKRVPRLTVRVASATSGVRVTRDDVELGAASLGVALPIDPGDHTIAVIAPGFATRLYRVSLGPGQARTLAVETGVPVEPQTSHRATAGYVVGGAGVAAIAVGAYFGVRALSSRATSDAGCTNGVCRDASYTAAYDDAKSFAHIADAAIGVGVVALAVGTFLVVTSPKSDDRAAKVAATPSGVGIRW